MLHHDRQFLAGHQAERQAAAARRRPPADAAELERAVHAARSGDGAAWSALVNRFSSRVRLVARRHRLGTSDVEDVVQTTWLRLLQHIGQLREPTAVGAWLETTARRECLRLIESADKERPSAFDDGLQPAEAAEPVEEAAELEPLELRRALSGAFGRLPNHQRELMTMLISETSPSYVAVSRALDMPIGSIGPTRARALARLRNDTVLVQEVARD